MGRKASVRQKNGYWFSEAGGVGRYFGRVAQVSYSEAMARLWAALAGGGDRGGLAGNDGDYGTIVQPSANEPFSPVGSHTAPEFVRSQSGASTLYTHPPKPIHDDAGVHRRRVDGAVPGVAGAASLRPDQQERRRHLRRLRGLEGHLDCRMAPGDVPG
jgi:hypothetical protein